MNVGPAWGVIWASLTFPDLRAPRGEYGGQWLASKGCPSLTVAESGVPPPTSVTVLTSPLLPLEPPLNLATFTSNSERQTLRNRLFQREPALPSPDMLLALFWGRREFRKDYKGRCPGSVGPGVSMCSVQGVGDELQL